MAFPQVGLEVILEIRKFQNQYNRVTKTVADLQKTFQRMAGVEKQFLPAETALRIAVAQENVKHFEKTLSDTAKVYAELQRAGATPGALQQIGDEFAKQQQNLIGATKELAVAEKAAQTGVAGLSSSFLAATAVVAGFVVGVVATVSIVREAIEDYTKFADSIHGVATAMGVSMEAASVWAKTARDLGVSTDVMTRGAAAFERQLESMKLAMLEGTEFNNNFTRALSYLGISVRDETTGAFRPAIDVFNETVSELQDMTAAAERTGLTYMLFGRQNRAMTEITADALRTQDEQRRVAERLGVVLGEDDRDALLALQQAESDAKDATQGLTNLLAGNFRKAATAALGLFTQWTIGIRMWIATASAAYVTLNDLINGTIKLDEVLEHHKEVYRDMMNIQSEEDKLAEAIRNKEAAAASAKMDYLEAEAHMIENRAEAYKKMLEDLTDAERDYQQQLEDLGRREERDAIERAIREAWEIEDIRDRQRERNEQKQKQQRDRLADLERDLGYKLEDLARDMARRREELEIDHRNRLLSIQQNYLDTVDEALRSNDTVALLRAMRQRSREVRDEKRAFDQRQQELGRQGEQKREDIYIDFQRRKEELARQGQELLQQEKDQAAEELAERTKQQERDRILRELHHKWTLEDLRLAYDRRQAEIKQQYKDELADQEAQLEQLRIAAYNGTFNIAKEVARAIETGGQLVLTAEEQWLARHALMYAESLRDIYSGAGGLTPEQQWRQRHNYFAEGGVDVAMSGARTVTYGEAGPEIAAFLPLRHTMSVNHRFGNLGVSLNGQSMNMNQGQVENVFWALMAQLPDILSGRG